MIRAQSGDRGAYRNLLEEMAPYLRALAVEERRSADQLEAFVQDVFRTVHTIRQTYDPARPFEPWLVAIARRRQAAWADGDLRLVRDDDHGGMLRSPIAPLPVSRSATVHLFSAGEIGRVGTARTASKATADLWSAVNSRLVGARRLLESLKHKGLMRRSDSAP